MTRSRRQRRLGGFTIIELLVVMGILILLAVLTGVSVSRLSKEARLSSGVNQVVAALGSARSIAIQTNSTVMVIFTVNVDPAQLGDGEIVEIVLARASGEITTQLMPAFSRRSFAVDAFVSLGGGMGETRGD